MAIQNSHAVPTCGCVVVGTVGECPGVDADTIGGDDVAYFVPQIFGDVGCFGQQIRIVWRFARRVNQWIQA